MVPTDHDLAHPKLKSPLRAGNISSLAKRVTLPVPQITYASRADEDVMLDPIVFRNVCTFFRISPTVDVFASVQPTCPNYFTADPNDTNALSSNVLVDIRQYSGAWTTFSYFLRI